MAAPIQKTREKTREFTDTHQFKFMRAGIAASFCVTEYTFHILEMQSLSLSIIGVVFVKDIFDAVEKCRECKRPKSK